MDIIQNTPNAYTLTMLRMPTEPATNVTTLNKWPCGYNTKKPSTTRLLTMPGRNLRSLCQAQTPSTEAQVVGMAQKGIQMWVTIWVRDLVTTLLKQYLYT